MFLRTHPNPGLLEAFDPQAISVLNSILLNTDVEIVISSDWKRWVSLAEMQRFYQSQEIIRTPIDYTPTLPVTSGLEQWRANEIKAWLQLHPEVTNWLAIDDLDLTQYLPCSVWVSEPSLGITQEGISRKIIKELRD